MDTGKGAVRGKQESLEACSNVTNVLWHISGQQTLSLLLHFAEENVTWEKSLEAN